jgi:hypothetical protein
MMTRLFRETEHILDLVSYVKNRNLAPDYETCLTYYGRETVDQAICRGWLKLYMDTDSEVLIVGIRHEGEPMFDTPEEF